MQKGITVYCASSEEIAPAYFEAARQLGAEIARAGVPVINGGGRMGLMAAVTDGALDAGGEAIGVIPQFMAEAGRNYARLTETIVTDSMHTRKKTMADLSIGAVALPGGIGTLDELAEIITWRKLGLYTHPVVILNTNGFYDSLLDWLARAQYEDFVDRHDVWEVTEDPTQAVEIIINAR